MPRALTKVNRRAVHERLDRVRRALSNGPRTAFEVVPEILDRELPRPMMIGWGLSETLCYLRRLEVRGDVQRLDGGDAERWTMASGRLPQLGNLTFRISRAPLRDHLQHGVRMTSISPAASPR
jgi:hypothetical protein